MPDSQNDKAVSHLKRYCSPAQAALALDRAVTKCGDSAYLPPGCNPELQWTTSRRYTGSNEPPSAQVLWQRRCAQHAFDSFLCALPCRSKTRELPKPPDWAFGRVPATPGKFLARWVMHLYLALTEDSPSRYVLPTAELEAWPWIPSHGCAAAQSASGWLLPDVCAVTNQHSIAGSMTLQKTRSERPALSDAMRQLVSDPARQASARSRRGWLGEGLSELLLIARGNSSGVWKSMENKAWVATKGGGHTSAGLWLAAQLVRHVRGAMGPCLRPQVRRWLRGAEPVQFPRTVLKTSATWAMEARFSAGKGTRSHLRRVALHIRRGDSCERYGSYGENDPVGRRRVTPRLPEKRPCFKAADYLRAAREVLADSPAILPSQLLVASDSPHAIVELRAAFAHPLEFEIMSARGERGAGWGGAAEGVNVGQARANAMHQFIEARNDAGLVNRSEVLASLFADLEMLAHADAFVGTAASWSSRLILLSIIGEAGVVPPFIFVDQPLKETWFT